MSDNLYQKCFEVYQILEKKNAEKNSKKGDFIVLDFSLDNGCKITDTKSITWILSKIPETFKGKSKEKDTVDAARKLEGLFQTNPSAAQKEWKRIVDEAVKQCDLDFNKLLQTWDQDEYSDAEVEVFHQNIPLWSCAHIVCKFGSKYKKYTLPQTVEVSLSWWNNHLRNLEKCFNEAIKNGAKPSTPILSWDMIIQYWKYITPLNRGPGLEKDRIEDNDRHFDTRTDAGLKKLSQKFQEIFDQNRIKSKGDEIQVALEEVCKNIRSACSSVEEFKKYKCNLEIAKNRDVQEQILQFCNLEKHTILNYSRAIEITKEGQIPEPVEFVNAVLTSRKISIPYELLKAERKKLPTKPQKKCPNCGTLHDENEMFCKRCGCVLIVKCPKCGNQVSTEIPKCIHCGFSISNLPLCEQAIDEAKNAFNRKDFTSCDFHLRNAMMLWPNHSGIQPIRNQLDELLEKQNKDKVHQYFQNIQITGSLKTEKISSNVIRLTWPRSTSSCTLPPGCTISYSVVRKENAIPGSAQDGIVLAETGQLFYEDTSVVPGQIYGYAVFPTINKIPHFQGYIGTKVMTVTGVSNLEVIPDSNSLRLSWDLPVKATGVKLFRKLGSRIVNPLEATSLPVTGKCNGYVDNNLQTNTTYYYRIVPVFTNVDGNTILGDPQLISGTPRTLPSEVSELNQTLRGDEIQVNWTPVTDGVVRLFLSSQPLGGKGTTISLSDSALSKVKEIVDSQPDQGQAIVHEKIVGVKYITPVTFSPYIGLIGESLKITQIRPILQIRVSRSNNQVFITWDWTPGINEVEIMYRNDTYPASCSDKTARKITVSRNLFEMEQGYVIHNAGNDNYYFSVFNTELSGNEKLYSPPCKVKSIGQNNKTVLNYHFYVKRSMLLFGEKQYMLQINVEKGPGTIPALVLLQKNRTRPLRRNDGIQVLEIPATPKKRMEKEIQGCQITSDSCFRLFVKFETQASLFQINDPAPEKMRFV